MSGRKPATGLAQVSWTGHENRELYLAWTRDQLGNK